MNQAETTGRDEEPRGLDVTMSSARDLVVANATEEAWGFPRLPPAPGQNKKPDDMKETEMHFELRR